MNLADLCTTKPADTHGTLIGVDDWRVVVEALLPAHPSSLWGVARWGIDVWSSLAWHDLTDDVEGAQIARGAHKYMDRPRIGQLDLTLDSTAGKYSPTSGEPESVYFAAGTVIRIGLASATDSRAGGWIPEITAIVDTWEESITELGAIQTVQITAYETLSSISNNVRTAQTPVGETDDFRDRMERLLDGVGWEFGYDFPGLVPFPTAEQTTQEGNVLAELYLSADSWRRVFRNHRDGRAVGYLPTNYYLTLSILGEFASSYVLGIAPITTTADGTTFVAYDADAVRTVNNRDHVINHARIGAVGFTVAEREHRSSIYKYRRRTFEQLNLVIDDMFGNYAETIAEQMVNARGRHTLRVAEAVISTSELDDDDSYLAVAAADIDDHVIYVPPGSTPGDADDPHIVGRIESITHRITPRIPNAALTWQTVLGLLTTDIANMPAAVLPEETFS